MKLHSLSPVKESRKKNKRVGRGIGSGKGKTATRGTKGQKSRSGSSSPAWFEGGRMPLQRLIPKRGFKNFTRIEYCIINLDKIEKLGLDIITPEILYKKRIIKKTSKVKILSNGELSKAVKFEIHAISKSAEEKILKAGGSVEIIKNRRIK